MAGSKTSKGDQILLENEDLRNRLRESEETLSAIRNGEVDAIVVSGKNGEQIFSLASAETPYRKILEEMNEGAVIVSNKGLILYCNRCFSEFVCLSQEQVTGADIRTFVAAEDRVWFKKLLHKSLSERTSGVVSCLTGKNTVVHAQLSFVALSQEINGDVCIVVSDITEIRNYQNFLQQMVERRAAELEEANGQLSDNLDKLEKSRKTLEASSKKYKLLYNRMRESEERFRTAFEKGAVPMALSTLKGEFFKVNKALCNLTGYSEAELTGKSFLQLTHHIDHKISRDGLKNLINGEMESFRMEKRYIRKNGDVIWVDMSTAPVRDTTGNMVYLITHVQDIDKRKKAETLLRESEEKYKEIVRNARSLIIGQDTSGKIKFFNEYAQELLGFGEDEVIGKSPVGIFVPEVEATGRNLGKMLEDIYKDPDKFRININENIKKNGERLWIEWHNKAMFDNEGKRSGHIAIGLDITDRLKAEETIKKSEENYRLLFEKMDEAFTLCEIILDDRGKSCDYRFLSANPSFEKQTGLKVEDITGKRVKEILPGIEQYWLDEFGQVALTGINREFENYSAPLNKYFRVSAFCPKKGQFAALFEDITLRKAAEFRLRESNEKLEIALESGHIGIWEWDLKTNEAKWDDRMEEIFGIDSGSFGGNHAEMEDLIHEEDLPHFRKAIVNSAETGSLFETIIRTRPLKGNPKHISTKALVNRDPYGNPVSLTGVCFDVTAMKKGPEKAIFKLNEELLRSNRELESFAYVASHDLQEPLRMVSSFTQLLEQKYGDKLDQDAHDYINFAVDGAKRMYDLINGLLAYSRVQTKGKEFAKVNMVEVFDKVQRNLSLKINERNAVITKNHLPAIYADESQMIQLVQNLIENGIKFSSGTPRIHFSSVEQADIYLFSVKDEGMGIDPRYFERIFKIFQRLMPKEEYEGTGIGLAICRRIVERHNGRIWLESEPGKGSTFFFALPRQQSD